MKRSRLYFDTKNKRANKKQQQVGQVNLGWRWLFFCVRRRESLVDSEATGLAYFESKSGTLSLSFRSSSIWSSQFSSPTH